MPETVAILASGPSLTQRDIDFCRGKAAVIALNTTYKNALWADILYAPDKRWWERMAFAPDFNGLKVSIEPRHRNGRLHGILYFRNAGFSGLEVLDDEGLRTGKDAGYQAINLAFHLGAKRILLLGYDMGPSSDGRHHHHPPHPGDEHMNYKHHLAIFETLVEPLRERGVDVLNCTRHTALAAFPTAVLEETLL